MTPDLRQTHPSTLASMVHLHADSQLWRDEELGQILHHQLDAPLQVDLGRTAEAGHRTAELSARAGVKTFGQLLMHVQPPGELLERVKDFAKASQGDADAPIPKEVATVIYLVSIAAARLRLDQRISTLSDAELCKGLKWCAARQWIAPSLQPLLNDTLSVLEQR